MGALLLRLAAGGKGEKKVGRGRRRGAEDLGTVHEPVLLGCSKTYLLPNMRMYLDARVS